VTSNYHLQHQIVGTGLLKSTNDGPETRGRQEMGLLASSPTLVDGHILSIGSDRFLTDCLAHDSEHITVEQSQTSTAKVDEIKPETPNTSQNTR
jgi:hypothetical protein